MIRFRVYGDPEAQGSMRVIRGRVIHDNPRLARWRDCITRRAIEAVRVPLDEPVWVEATFWLAPPRHPRWRVPATAKDLDKLTRALGDALSPRYGRRPIENDSRICGWTVEKRWADADHDPGVLVTIRREGEHARAS